MLFFITVKDNTNIASYWEYLYTLDNIPEEHKPNIGIFAKSITNLYQRVVPMDESENPEVDEMNGKEASEITKEFKSPLNISKPVDISTSTVSSNIAQQDMATCMNQSEAEAGQTEKSISNKEVKESDQEETSNISVMDAPVPTISAPILDRIVISMPLIDFSE